MIERANVAQAEWARVPGLERSASLNAFIDAVEARADDLAEAGTLEQGKLFRESKGEALKCCSEGRFSVGEAGPHGGNVNCQRAPRFLEIKSAPPARRDFLHQPLEFPDFDAHAQNLPSFGARKCVVMKPSQFTPAANFIIAEISKEFFPDNLIQVAMVAGQHSKRSHCQRRYSWCQFHGLRAYGKLVYAAAAQNLIPVQAGTWRQERRHSKRQR